MFNLRVVVEAGWEQRHGLTFQVDPIDGVAARKGQMSLWQVTDHFTLNSTTVATLVKQTMNTMTWLKLKFAATVGATLLLAGGLAIVARSDTGRPAAAGDNSAQGIVQKSRAAYAALTSYRDSGTITQMLGGMASLSTFNLRLQRPNRYRVAWSQTSPVSANGGVVWSAGEGDYVVVENGKTQALPQKYGDMPTALGAATGISGGASATIPGTFFQQNWGNALLAMPALARHSDAPVTGVDCYVVSTTLDPASLPNGGQLPGHQGSIGRTTTTLWIGKQDYLIHQTQTTIEGMDIKLPEMTDDRLKNILKLQNRPATPEAIATLRQKLETANQKAKSLMAAGPMIFTQTHEHIVTNPPLAAADFAR